MTQYVDQVTHGKEILDLCFSNNPDLISHIATETFPMFTDHKIVILNVAYILAQKPQYEEMSLLDSGHRLKKLDFCKADWSVIQQELSRVDWTPMKLLAKRNVTVAHSWFIQHLLSVLEKLVPLRMIKQGRNGLHRKRKLIWRKLNRLKSKLKTETSVKKIVQAAAELGQAQQSCD